MAQSPVINLDDMTTASIEIARMIVASPQPGVPQEKIDKLRSFLAEYDRETEGGAPQAAAVTLAAKAAGIRLSPSRL